MSDSLGFWEPHSSSVDFCEPNYLHSVYVAETHNAWSSLYMVLLTSVGMLYSNPTNELRNTTMFLVLFFVGWGSVGLHGTLHWVFQSADEVPMLWMNLAFFFALNNIYTPIGESTTKMAAFLTLVGVVQTYVYYTFQQYYWIFIATYVAGVVVIVLHSAYLTFAHKNSIDFPVRWWLFSRAIFSYVIIAAVLWIVEMNFCSTFLPYFTAWQGLSFHILWHIGAGLGTYLEILFLVTLRCQALGGVVEVQWVPRCAPIVPIVREIGRKNVGCM